MLGAIATAIVLFVFIITKFLHGAWLVVIIIPTLVVIFKAIHRHYVSVSEQLATSGTEKLKAMKHEVIVPISGLHRGVLLALQYARSIARKMSRLSSLIWTENPANRCGRPGKSGTSA